jgi:ubiquinone/menaquinone biosynthesis C-methylase UbiE
MSTSTHLALAYHQWSRWQFQHGRQLLALAAPAPNEHVLDVGCGTGALTYLCARAVLPHGRVTAIDPDTARLAIAVKQCPPDVPNITWLAIPAEALRTHAAVAGQTFQVIYANYVLHRVQDPRVVLRNIAHALCPGGRFVMQTVVDMPSLVRELTLLTGPRGAQLIHSFTLLSPLQWQQLFEEVGLHIEQTAEVADDQFANLEELVQWWEATNPEGFAAAWLAPEHLGPFRTRCAAGVALYGKETWLVAARKPG